MKVKLPEQERPIDVVIGLPTHDGTFKPDMLKCYNALRVYSEKAGVACQHCERRGPHLPLNRQDCVDVAMAYESKYLLFIDSDMVFPEDALERLMAHDVDIVSGLYFQKMRPFNPHAYILHRDVLVPIDIIPPNSLQDNLDSVGAGFLLIKTKILKGISRPHFQFWNLPDGSPGGGEDSFFCDKARGRGHKIHLDTGLILGHINDQIIGPTEYLRYQEEKRIAKAQEAAADAHATSEKAKIDGKIDRKKRLIIT